MGRNLRKVFAIAVTLAANSQTLSAEESEFYMSVDEANVVLEQNSLLTNSVSYATLGGSLTEEQLLKTITEAAPEKQSFIKRLVNVFRKEEKGPQPPYFTPTQGLEVEQVKVIVGGQPVLKYWRELEPDTWRSLLQDSFFEAYIFDSQLDAGISLGISGGGSADVKLAKGDYKLKYYNFKMKRYPCSKDKPNIGFVMVGVGAVISVDAKFRKSSINASLPTLTASFAKNKLTGRISSIPVGFGDNATIRQMASAATGAITYESLTNASGFMSVANQALEKLEDVTNPVVVGYMDNQNPGACEAAYVSAAAKVAQTQ